MFTCAVCHAKESRDEVVAELFQIDGQYVLVDRIPAIVCARCGEESFSRITTEKIGDYIVDAANRVVIREKSFG